MKFNAITGIWTIAVVLFTFQVMLFVYEADIVYSIIYSFMCFLNGALFGLVLTDWVYTK